MLTRSFRARQPSSDHDCPRVTVVDRSLSHVDRTPRLSAPGSRPLRPRLAVPLSASHATRRPRPPAMPLTRRLRPCTTVIVVPGRVHRIRARHLPAPGVVLVRRPFPHRTDCCRLFRRSEGVKDRFACT